MVDKISTYNGQEYLEANVPTRLDFESAGSELETLKQAVEFLINYPTCLRTEPDDREVVYLVTNHRNFKITNVRNTHLDLNQMHINFDIDIISETELN